MANDLTRPDPTIILDLIQGFRCSKTMFTAVSLGVFDALADGPKTLPVLTAELRAHPDALERLLNACVCLGLLERDAQDYRNTSAATAYLCKSSPLRMTGYITYSNDVLWKLWEHLEDAIREGTHRWRQTYGWDGPLFDHFFHSEAAKREFLIGMHGYGVMTSPHVVAAFDLSGFQHLVDLGSATGHLAIAACQRYPNLRATVFDLPAAVPLAREVVGSSSVSQRVSVVAGDFFVDPLPAGDLFALGRIVHDWAEQKILTLLTRIQQQLPPGGGLLLAEKLLTEDKRAPLLAHMQSLNMLVCTEGKERTLTEYEALLRRVGFDDVVGCRTPAALDAVLARKPS
jgi:acetylserotonin N-methyltransferase